VDQAKRLKQLETENGRLKKLVADLLLKRQFLQPHHLQEKRCSTNASAYSWLDEFLRPS
jgi:hypothetical protein